MSATSRDYLVGARKFGRCCLGPHGGIHRSFDMPTQLDHRGYIYQGRCEHRSNVLPPVSWSINTLCRYARLILMSCPSGYYLADGLMGEVVGACQSDVSTGQSGTWAYTDDGSAWSTITTTVSASLSTVGAIAIVGWNVKQTSVISTTLPSTMSVIKSSSILISSTSTASSSAPTIISAASYATATSSAISDHSTLVASQPALSTGARVGIGLAVALGVLGAISLLVSLYLTRKRRSKRQDRAWADGTIKPPGSEVEMRIRSLDQDFKEYKTWTTSRELDDTRQVSQLHSVPVHGFTAELSG